MHNKNQRRPNPPSSSRAPLKSKMAVVQGEADTVAFRVPRDFPHSRFSRAPLAVYPPKGGRPRACVSLPVVSLEKMPCLSQSEGAQVKVTSSSSTLDSSSSSSSSSSPSTLNPALVSPASHKSQEKLMNGRGPTPPRSATPPLLNDRRPSPSRSPLDKWPAPSPSSQDRRLAVSPSLSLLDRRPGVSPSSPDRKHPNESKVIRHKRVSGRIYDPNKHCGVLDPETKMPCTHSLTCKTHSLTHRRAVSGRRKEFDVLLAEHKGRAKEKEAGQKKEAVNSQSTRSSSQPVSTLYTLPPSCHNGKATPRLKLQLPGAHVHRGCGSGDAVVLGSALMPTPMPAPWFGGDARMSGDDGECEVIEETEKAWCCYSPHHPRPVGWCAFSSRVMGRGHYVFDRRWDRVRIALHCMVQKHVSTQMWRKVPLAVESVVSVSQSSPPPSSPPPPSPAPGCVSTLDGISMVSKPFSYMRDVERPLRLHHAKLAELPRALEDVKTRKPPHATEAGTLRKNGNGEHPPPGPALISNGTVVQSGRAKARVAGQITPDPGRYGGLSCPPSCSSAQGRRRRISGAADNDRPGKVTKTVLDGIFRKSSAGLLASVTEVSHSALPW